MRNWGGRTIGVGIVVGAILAAALTFREASQHPETQDAEVYANLIEIAPQVSGPILKLYVKDNQLVKRGDLLFEIDPQPFQFALDRAISEQSALEGQIADMRRTIAVQQSAIDAAAANVSSSQANVKHSAAAVSAAEAELGNAQAALARGRADAKYATNNLQRLEPLLAKQFVTVDVVDQARTLQATRVESVRQAEAEVARAEAQLRAELSRVEQSHAMARQSAAQFTQSQYGVPLLQPLEAQRGARAASVKNAQYDLTNCRVYAPFDGRITNLGISEGFYAHAGSPVFTLIDTRTWWAIGEFRETQLSAIKPGMIADVYLMSASGRKFEGTVESIGFGVAPDESLNGASLHKTLPEIQRTLNWVHLATRFPVRVRVENPPMELFRIGTSATIVVRGENKGTAR